MKENEEGTGAAVAIEEAPTSPIVAGKTKKKLVKKVAAKKATPAKKAAAPAAKKAAAPAAKKAAATSTNGASRAGSKFADEAVITVLKPSEHKGKRGAAMSCLKNGMTVAKFRDAVINKAGLDNWYASTSLKIAVAGGIIKVQKAAK